MVRSPAKEPADVTAIFAMQRVTIVFGMSLKEEKQTPALPHERIRAGLGRSQQDSIVPGGEYISGEAVMPRMRHEPPRRLIRDQGMVIGGSLALEDAG